jgi:hypothetical protein
MTDHDGEIRLSGGERGSIARRLRREHPDLSRASEARIRRRVMATARERQRPARMRLLILAYAVSGSLLLAFAAVGLAGVGPLAF